MSDTQTSDTFAKNLRVLEYLRKIEIPEILQGKTEIIYELFRRLCPDPILDVFISDYIDSEGNRMYEHLRFFSEKYVMSAMNFVTEEDFRITPIKKQILQIQIEKQDYDFENATERSRLSAIVEFGTTKKAVFKASKRNCDYLRNIVRKFIIPNLQE